MVLPALPAFPPLPLLSPSSYLCSYDAASAEEDGALDEDLEEEETDEVEGTGILLLLASWRCCW